MRGWMEFTVWGLSECNTTWGVGPLSDGLKKGKTQRTPFERIPFFVAQLQKITVNMGRRFQKVLICRGPPFRNPKKESSKNSPCLPPISTFDISPLNKLTEPKAMFSPQKGNSGSQNRWIHLKSKSGCKL